MARQPSHSPPEERPSWLKRQMLKILRSLITRLQAIADRLETPPLSTPQQPIFPLWDQLLAWVRGKLSDPWNSTINDFDLSLLIGAVITLSLILSVSLIPRPAPELTQLPEPPEPTETIEEPEIEVPEIPSEPEAPPEDTEPEPIPEESPEPVSESVEEDISAEPEPPETEKPLEEEETNEPIPVEIAPPPILTPEQRLIVTIQEQVNQLTQKYEEGLIDSLQADFLNSLLVLKVDRRWYELPLEQQKRLANDMFKRARKLDFTRLEILDLQGYLLARNSLVGNNMVILKTQDFDATT